MVRLLISLILMKTPKIIYFAAIYLSFLFFHMIICIYTKNELKIIYYRGFESSSGFKFKLNLFFSMLFTLFTINMSLSLLDSRMPDIIPAHNNNLIHDLYNF